jgi:hypothetical protein
MMPGGNLKLSIFAQRNEVMGEATQKGVHLNGLYTKIFRYSELAAKISAGQTKFALSCSVNIIIRQKNFLCLKTNNS